MSRVVVLGAGISGHTTAAFLRKWLGRDDEVIVVSPKPTYNWIPSNIWVRVGVMSPADVGFPLAPVYERHGIEFKQARAVELHPEGRADDPAPDLVAKSTRPGHEAEREDIRYDFLINATGPKLNFGAPPGLGPGGHSLSVCTETHAAEAAQALEVSVERMRRGERQRFLVGTGHGGCTCEGAAFEYIVNLEFELRARGVRDRADIQWISNEYELGDFGMGGDASETRRLREAQQDLHGITLSSRTSTGSRAPTSVNLIRTSRITKRSRGPNGRSRSTLRCCCRRSPEWV